MIKQLLMHIWVSLMIDMIKNSKILAVFLGGVLATMGVGQVSAQSMVFDHRMLEQFVEQCQTVLIEQSIDSIVPAAGNVSSYPINKTARKIIIRTKGSDFIVSVRAVKAVDGASDTEKLVACRIYASTELFVRMPDLTNKGSAALSAELIIWFDAFLDGIIEQNSMLVMETTRQAILCLDDNRIILFSLRGSGNAIAETIYLEMILLEDTATSNGDSVVSLRYACEAMRGQN